MLLRVSILAERARARMSSRYRRAVAPDRGVLIAGRAMADEYRKHWLIKDVREPNRFVRAGSGTRRTHFWRQIAQSLRLVSTKGNSVDMRVGDRRFRQKLFGGPIVAKVARMLTIPVHPFAYARTAAEVELLQGADLMIRRTRGNRLVLGMWRAKRWISFFLLKYAVFQRPWPGTLPPPGKPRRAFMRAFWEWLDGAKLRRT
jgi:hypothetical protein